MLKRKDNTRALAAFMAKRGYQPQDVVIVGDSDEEPAIARQLGLTSIGITDGYITEKRLRAAKPDYIINSLKEIASIVSSRA